MDYGARDLEISNKIVFDYTSLPKPYFETTYTSSTTANTNGTAKITLPLFKTAGFTAKSISLSFRSVSSNRTNGVLCFECPMFLPDGSVATISYQKSHNNGLKLSNVFSIAQTTNILDIAYVRGSDFDYENKNNIGSDTDKGEAYYYTFFEALADVKANNGYITCLADITDTNGIHHYCHFNMTDISHI